MLSVLDRLLAGGLDQMMHVALAVVSASAKVTASAMISPCVTSVSTHAYSVNFQPLGDIDDRGQRARCHQHQHQQRRPFGVPGPALRSWSCTCAAKIVAARLGPW